MNDSETVRPIIDHLLSIDSVSNGTCNEKLGRSDALLRDAHHNSYIVMDSSNYLSVDLRKVNTV